MTSIDDSTYRGRKLAAGSGQQSTTLLPQLLLSTYMYSRTAYVLSAHSTRILPDHNRVLTV